MCSNFDDKVIMINGDPDITRILTTIYVHQKIYSWGELHGTFRMTF